MKFDTSSEQRSRMVFWGVGLTVASSERMEILTMAAHEGRSAAAMVRELTREARAARKAATKETPQC